MAKDEEIKEKEQKALEIIKSEDCKVEIISSRNRTLILDDIQAIISSEACNVRRKLSEGGSLGMDGVKNLSYFTRTLKDIGEIEEKESKKILIDLNEEQAVEAIIEAVKRSPDLQKRLATALMELANTKLPDKSE